MYTLLSLKRHMATPVECHEIPLRDSLILIMSLKLNTNRSPRQITVGYLKILLLLLLLLDRIHARFPRLDAFDGRSQISKPKFNDSTLSFSHHRGPLIDKITKLKSFWHYCLGLTCCGALTGWAISVYSSQMID